MVKGFFFKLLTEDTYFIIAGTKAHNLELQCK